VTYKVEFEADDGFVAGCCYDCPYQKSEYISWVEDGYTESDVQYECGLGFETYEACGLIVDDIKPTPPPPKPDRDCVKYYQDNVKVKCDK
jgi:hypothetical protein